MTIDQHRPPQSREKRIAIRIPLAAAAAICALMAIIAKLIGYDTFAALAGLGCFLALAFLFRPGD